MLGGVDCTGPHLYTIYPHGSTDKVITKYDVRNKLIMSDAIFWGVFILPHAIMP